MEQLSFSQIGLDNIEIPDHDFDLENLPAYNEIQVNLELQERFNNLMRSQNSENEF